MDFTNYFQGLQHLKLFYNVGIPLERWENLEDEKQRITVLFFIHFGVCSQTKPVTIKKLMFMCWLANMKVFRVHQHIHCGLKSYTVVLMFCPDVPFSSCLMINVHSF